MFLAPQCEVLICHGDHYWAFIPCLFCLPVYYSDCYLDYDSCCLPRPSSLFIDSTCLPPAPTFCPSSDLCFVLSTVVNKLQMDHQASDSSHSRLSDLYNTKLSIILALHAFSLPSLCFYHSEWCTATSMPPYCREVYLLGKKGHLKSNTSLEEQKLPMN